MSDSEASIVSRIVTALRAGQQLDLLSDLPFDSQVDEATMRTWPAEHEVDANVLRDLLRGADAQLQPDPRGLRLRGVRIRGRLDLDLVTADVRLELQDCLLEQGISASQAHLPALAALVARSLNLEPSLHASMRASAM